MLITTMLIIVLPSAQANVDSLGLRPPIYGEGGGLKEFRRDVMNLLPEPDSMVAIGGKVFVGFTISEQGEVHDVRVLRGLHPVYDSITVAGVRAAAARTRWQPQLRDGQPESVTLSMPIVFRVDAGAAPAPPPSSPLPSEVYLRPDRMPVYGANGYIREFARDVEEALEGLDVDSLVAAGVALTSRVMVWSMIVNAQGKIELLRAATDNVHPMMENAVIEAVSSIKTKWAPGLHQGLPVSTKLAFEIRLSGDFPIYDTEPTFDDASGFELSSKKFKTLVQHAMIYPEMAAEKGITGTVSLYISINEHGKLEGVKVVRSAHRLLDAEAMRAVKTVLRRKKWHPGVINGRAVPLSIYMSLVFSLGLG